MWQNVAVKAEIDRFGRILIPKPIRDRLGLTAGAEVELREEGGKVTIETVEESHVMTRDASGLIVLHAEMTAKADPVDMTRGERSRTLFEEPGR